MLRKWEERSALACTAWEPGLEEDHEEQVLGPVHQDKETWGNVMIDSSLRPEQCEQEKRLLEEYSDIFTDTPRQTQLIEHHFHTTSEQLIH